MHEIRRNLGQAGSQEGVPLTFPSKSFESRPETFAGRREGPRSSWCLVGENEAQVSRGDVNDLTGPRTNLLHRTLRLEQDPPAKELAENAADAPHVHGGSVVACPQQDFRCTIILRHHFLGHVLVLVGLLHSRQSEVADLFAEKPCNIPRLR